MRNETRSSEGSQGLLALRNKATDQDQRSYLLLYNKNMHSHIIKRRKNIYIP